MNNDILFLNREWGTRFSLTNFENHFGLLASVIFRPQYVWFLTNSSGQLTELIAYIILPE